VPRLDIRPSVLPRVDAQRPEPLAPEEADVADMFAVVVPPIPVAGVALGQEGSGGEEQQGENAERTHQDLYLGTGVPDRYPPMDGGSHRMVASEWWGLRRNGGSGMGGRAREGGRGWGAPSSPWGMSRSLDVLLPYYRRELDDAVTR